MANTFTKAIIREIGRNYGKAISNQLLGDAHSTPYRRVGGGDLGSSTGGYKYENNLDRLIQKFEVKGAVATFNSGQNIFNAYFELVDEAKADKIFDWHETAYLCQQYKRTVIVLNRISEALLELGSKDKQQKIAQKIIDMSAFIDELNKVYEKIPATKKQIDKKYLNYYKFLIIASIILAITFLIGVFGKDYLSIKFDSTMSVVLFVSTILSFGLSIYFKEKYYSKKNDEEKRVEKLINIKKLVSETADIVSYQYRNISN